MVWPTGDLGEDFNSACLLGGGFGVRFAAPEAKIARTRIGSVTPTTNGSGSYNGGAESSIRVGARAAAVDERDDGGALSSRREGFFFAKNRCMSTILDSPLYLP